MAAYIRLEQGEPDYTIPEENWQILFKDYQTNKNNNLTKRLKCSTRRLKTKTLKSHQHIITHTKHCKLYRLVFYICWVWIYLFIFRAKYWRAGRLWLKRTCGSFLNAACLYICAADITSFWLPLCPSYTKSPILIRAGKVRELKWCEMFANRIIYI